MRRQPLGITLAFATATAAATTAFALPNPNAHVRAGANHHLGDDSFIAKYGHAVDAHASEMDRMHQHLQFVRDWLASRPATRPELAAKRAEILAHFDAYIAKNTTPKNAHVPWRTPVFIDDAGTICAVGYLIQQTTNHALPEKIAKAHRYDYIEDIAHDMPEVAAWVADSGFTLDEIAHIQPAYTEPKAGTWRTWDLASYPRADGPVDFLGSRGTLAHGKMEGEWIAYTADDKTHEETVTGRGTLTHGAGAWTSFYDDGAKFAEGRYVDNAAHGPWKLYHHSGRIAAEGSFDRGDRAGLWRFYRDDAAQTPIAIGRFDRSGTVTGTWQHFDETGKLLATTTTATPDQWNDTDWSVDGGEGFLLDVVAAPGEVKHVSHRGTVNSAPLSLDSYALGGERIYVHAMYEHTTIYDADGDRLVRATDGSWTAANCGWNAKRKDYAHRGDLVPLHGALYAGTRLRLHPPKYQGIGSGWIQDDAGPTCKAPVAVAAARAAKLEPLYAEMTRVEDVNASDVRGAVLDEESGDGDAAAPAQVPAGDAALRAHRDALALELRREMSDYIEWPHVDGKFVDLFDRMAGRKTLEWSNGDPERDAYHERAFAAKASREAARAARTSKAANAAKASKLAGGEAKQGAAS